MRLRVRLDEVSYAEGHRGEFDDLLEESMTLEVSDDHQRAEFDDVVVLIDCIEHNDTTVTIHSRIGNVFNFRILRKKAK